MLQVFPTIRSLFPLLLIGSEKHLSLESSNLGLWEEEKHQVPQLIGWCWTSITALTHPWTSHSHSSIVFPHYRPCPITSSHATCLSVIHASLLQSNHFKKARCHSIAICAAPPEQPSLNTRTSNVQIASSEKKEGMISLNESSLSK